MTDHDWERKKKLKAKIMPVMSRKRASRNLITFCFSFIHASRDPKALIEERNIMVPAE
jgi:hypothetical protein